MKTRLIKNSDFVKENKFAELSKQELKKCSGGGYITVYHNPDGTTDVIISIKK
jgi:hypothetical protein